MTRKRSGAVPQKVKADLIMTGKLCG